MRRPATCRALALVLIGSLAGCADTGPGPSGTADAGAGCGPGLVSVGESCLPSCDLETPCPGELTCASGVCVEIEGTTACDDDDGCAPGWVCLESLCEMGHRPSVSLISPEDGSTLGLSSPIVLRFDTPMDRESLALAGGLGGVATPVWSTATATDDTLTLQPSGDWPAGEGTLIVDAESAAAVPLLTLSLGYTVDGTLAAVAADPPSGAHLNALSPIRVSFSKSVQPETLGLAGDMADEAQADWYEDTRPNDTLELTPVTAWGDGTARTLVVQATDEAGNLTAMLELVYDVDSEAPMASASPPDGSRIAASATLRIDFDKPMGTDTLVLEGSLAPVAVIAWDSDNDRLTLTPSPSWPVGAGETLTVDCRDTFDNPLETMSLSYDVDVASPTAVVTPENDSPISASATIVVAFSEGMDTASLSLGGTMAADVGDTTWTASAVADDTLALTPDIGGWTLPGTLIVEAQDRAGNPLAPLSLTYRPLADFPVIQVPVHAVRVADDASGTKQARVTADQVAQWVDEANRIYAESGIHFVFEADEAGPDWTDLVSPLINQIMGVGDPDWIDERDAANAEAADHAGKMTVFFRWGSGTSPTGGGFSWTDYNFVAMPGFNDTGVCGHQNIGLFAHEVGHYLGLAHPFAGVYSDVSSAETAFVNNGRDPAFFDGDRLLDTPADPYISANQCDTSVLGVTLDGVPFALPRWNIMTYYEPRHELSALQIMTVRQGALVRTGQSLTSLLPGTFLAPLEGEDLGGTPDESSGGPVVQSNMRVWLGNWSGDAQLFWGGASGPGATLEIAIGGIPAGTYRVWVGLTQAPDYGIFDFFLNGQRARSAVDLYNVRVTQGPVVDLGVAYLLAAGNEMVVEVVGSHPVAYPDSYAFGLDWVMLEAVD